MLNKTTTTMKHILKLGLMASLATAFVFAGCKDDNKDDNKDDEIEIKILPRKVTKIIESDGYDYSYTYVFDSDGRIIQEIDNNNDTYTYQYTSDLITRTTNSIDTLSSYNLRSIEYIIENERISSYVLKYGHQGKYEWNGRPLFNIRRVTCSYSDNGYISKIEEASEIRTEEPNYVIEYTVENGNLTSRKIVSWVTESDLYDSETIIPYTYNSTLNNLNVNLWFIIMKDKPIMDYLGTRFKKLPATETGANNYLFSYEYDGEYLTKITRSYDANGTKNTRIWEIFYE